MMISVDPLKAEDVEWLIGIVAFAIYKVLGRYWSHKESMRVVVEEETKEAVIVPDEYPSKKEDGNGHKDLA